MDMEASHSLVVMDSPVQVSDVAVDARHCAADACAPSAMAALQRLGADVASRILIVLDELMPAAPDPTVTIRFAGVDRDGQCTFELTTTDADASDRLYVRCTRAGWLTELAGQLSWRD
jgi:hypothetical protein